MISFIAAWYYDDVHPYIPILPLSLQQQSVKDWELILLHDGPVQVKAQCYVDWFKCEHRIRFITTDRRLEQWGHPLRELGLNYISSESEFVVHSNADNVYLPSFLDLMTKTIRPNDVGIYCDCLHSHYHYDGVFQSRLCRAGIDLGCMMLRTRVALEAGFKSRAFDADWDLFEEVIDNYSMSRFAHLIRPVFIHN